MSETAEELSEEFDPDVPKVLRVTKELKAQAVAMGRDEVRCLVDAYYQEQDRRKAAANQHRSGVQGTDKPALPVLEWLIGNFAYTELQIKNLLGVYAAGNPVGQWSQSIYGIGPVISAGLLAHIDIAKAPHVSNIWSFAGLNPTQEWLGTEKAKVRVADILGRSSGKVERADVELVAATCKRRAETLLRDMVPQKSKTGEPTLTVEKLSASLARIPWNKGLKTLCWKVGQSFLKFSGQDECFYGGLYLKRKAFEVAQNEAGAFSDQAARIIATKKFKAKPREDVGEAAEEDFKRAVEWYRQGKLPPAHLEARAERWTVKVFLAHFHQVAFFCAYGEVPPKPWILDIGGHDKEIKCPNWALVLNQ